MVREEFEERSLRVNICEVRSKWDACEWKAYKAIEGKYSSETLNDLFNFVSNTLSPKRFLPEWAMNHRWPSGYSWGRIQQSYCVSHDTRCCHKPHASFLSSFVLEIHYFTPWKLSPHLHNIACNPLVTLTVLLKLILMWLAYYLRGPYMWAREVALPRYLSYPVAGGIAGPPGLRGT
jgi:hypothetical protein